MNPINNSPPDFFVGTIPIYGKAILSPMDGISDWPFRSICRELGSAISYTEFVSVAEILTSPRDGLSKLFFSDQERPIAIQIYGENPDHLLEAALILQDLGPDFIDINMGCPSKSIANRGAGVGLMRTPLKIARIFRKLSANLQIPVTGKIRLGWDDHCLTYPLVARIIAENGGQLISLHARTGVQGYTGTANWDAIAEIVNLVGIPVLGNGGINTVADIQKMIELTGCAGVMVGRAAVANPWIFAGQDRESVTPQQVREMMLVHLERNLAFYGPELGLVLFRKYAASYLTPYRLPREIRKKLLTRKQPKEFLALLCKLDLVHDLEEKVIHCQGQADIDRFLSSVGT